jgi:hypothetical protein
MRIKSNIFFFLLIIVFFLSLFTTWYAQLVFGLFLILIVLMLDKLGKGIVLREIVALHVCFICLLMPLAGYTFFDRSDHLAKMWVRYMPVPQEVYFGFALPALTCFAMALFWPSGNAKKDDSGVYLQDTIVRARAIFPKKQWTGLQLMLIGTLMFWAAPYVPDVLQFVLVLFFFASFAGFLYVFYTSTFPFRKLTLTFFSIFILMTALNSGMFTIVAYMGLTLFSFFFLGKRTPFWKKFLWFLTGAFMLLLIQSVKPAYRHLTWKGGGYTGNKALLFGNLLADKVFNFDWNSADAFFPIYYRTNQGFNVGLVIRRFPNIKPYDNGANLLLNGASALVPRFIWPDKPEAGGKFNMQYYAGLYINGWSTNVGPLGEAYGSFGPIGGIVFMFCLGLFIRWVYRRVFGLARGIPLLIFWIPVIFYQVTYSGETDTLQILNSLSKSAFFIWLLYKLVPTLFAIEKKKSFRVPRQPVEDVSPA